MTIRKGDKIIAGNSSSTSQIGDIGIGIIDESLNYRRYLNGQEILQNQFKSFTARIKDLVKLYPNISCTEEQFETACNLSPFGQCGKFVIKDDKGTIKLPKIVNLQGVFDLSQAGLTVEAGLPNHTHTENFPFSEGVRPLINDFDVPATQGTPKALKQNIEHTSNDSYDLLQTGGASNAIYGKSATVQQEAIQYPYFIQVATGVDTTINVVRQIELNNPFSLLDYKFSEYELNNISWLHSYGQYNTKAVYPSVYDLLLKIYNGTETKAGVSVKLTTETFTDYDFVLNISEETFRLPTLVKQTFFNGINGNFPVVGNGMTLGLTNGTQLGGFSVSNDNANPRTANYGTAVGTANGSGTMDGKTLGVTTDASKSGLVAQVSQSAVNGLYLYFYVGETIQDANLVNVGRIEEKLVDCVSKSSLVEVQTVIETYQNGTSWYRVWTDGWCEQGGYITAGGTVSLLKPFKDTTYSIVLGSSYTTAGTATAAEVWNNKTTTNFTIHWYYGNGLNWQACGYIT